MSAGTITIRVARPSDADAMASLASQLGYEAEPSAVADRLSRVLARNDQQFLVAARTEVRKRLAEARGITLKEYTEKIALPVWRREGIAPAGDSATVSQQGSLVAILDRLRANPRVHIMHSADDILADRGSIEELKAVMGPQMTLYPYGGHLGSLWYPPIRDRVLGLFTPVVEAREER